MALAMSISAALADDAPMSVVSSLYDQSNTSTLGLSAAPGTETVTIFAPTSSTNQFSNGVVMTAFKGDLYCMWQSSATDEDATDTWVAYSRSTDGGATWSQPMELCPTISSGYCSSGGWIATDDELVAFINTWPSNLSNGGGYTRYMSSTDGLTWTTPADVTMADGSTLNGIFEQDPHVLPGGRIVNAAHFQPGLHVCPIYTDDPTGKTGWKKGTFSYTDNGTQSRELEPSMYRKSDGTLVMIFRDQNSTYYKMAASSADNGETWTKAAVTNFPDSRSKQSAGNLSDGKPFIASNPVNNKLRIPLVLTLSNDGGTVFDEAYLLRSNDDIQALRFSGKAKRAGYHYPKSLVYGDYVYVSYATNKEDVQYTRVPVSSISGIETVRMGGKLHLTVGDDRQLFVETGGGSATVEIFALSGAKAASATVDSGGSIDLSGCTKGTYIIKVKTDRETVSKTVMMR